MTSECDVVGCTKNATRGIKFKDDIYAINDFCYDHAIDFIDVDVMWELP